MSKIDIDRWGNITVDNVTVINNGKIVCEDHIWLLEQLIRPNNATFKVTTNYRVPRGYSGGGYVTKTTGFGEESSIGSVSDHLACTYYEVKKELKYSTKFKTIYVTLEDLGLVHKSDIQPEWVNL